MLRANATAEALQKVTSVLGIAPEQAMNLSVAEKYIEAFANLAKESNTVVVPANVGDAAGMVTQMLSVMKGIQK